MTGKRVALLCALALTVASCGKDTPSGPSSLTAIFIAQLLPANETPAVTNAEAAATGSVTITMNVTQDAAKNVSGATAQFDVRLSGFPAGATITACHIHEGVAGLAGPVRVNCGLAAGEVGLSGGAATFTKGGLTVDPAMAQSILGNPAGWYFNVHSVLNPGGVVRGQLSRTQ